MSTEIKAGDVVRLKSGGPAMTVEAVDLTHFDASVVWFDNKSNRCEDSFLISSLMKAT